MILSFCLLLLAIVKSKRVGVELIRLIFAYFGFHTQNSIYSTYIFANTSIMNPKKLSKFKQANVLRIICFMQQIICNLQLECDNRQLRDAILIIVILMQNFAYFML